MLRLKQALNDCKVPQQAFVAASGWSKTQVSLTLNTGNLPKDKGKFAAAVVTFALGNPLLVKWLDDRQLPPESLLETIPGTTAPAALAHQPEDEMETVLVYLIGKATIGAVEGADAVRLAMAAHYLYGQARYYAGFQAPEIDAALADILEGAP